MKKITCIQQYVIDNLIEDKILTSNSLLDAVSQEDIIYFLKLLHKKIQILLSKN